MLRNDRFLPTVVLPNLKNIRYAAASTLTNIDQVEHFPQRFVARIGNASPAHLIFSRSDIPRIFKNQVVFLLADHHTSGTKEIRIDQTVHQRLAQSFVNRCIVNPVSAYHFKRDFDILDDL